MSDCYGGRWYISSADIAMIYVGLQDNDQAFVWLQKAYWERSWYLVLFRADPRLDNLRPDPRFQDLLRGIGFLKHSLLLVRTSQFEVQPAPVRCQLIAAYSITTVIRV
jgi:hypothetical protein